MLFLILVVLTAILATATVLICFKENDRQTRMEDKRVLDLMMENEGLKAQIKEFKKTSAWKMYEMVRKKDS